MNEFVSYTLLDLPCLRSQVHNAKEVRENERAQRFTFDVFGGIKVAVLQCSGRNYIKAKVGGGIWSVLAPETAERRTVISIFTYFVHSTTYQNLTETMESIHHQFVVSTQSMSSRYFIFNTITEWISHLRKALELDNPENLSDSCTNEKLRALLAKEIDTWDLLVKLYYYRLIKSDENVDMDDEVLTEKVNEVATVKKLIEQDQKLKEVSLTLEWLEAIYGANNREPTVTARDINWEHTLAQLKRDKQLGKPPGESMVTQIDPDACLRENRKLHPMDIEEDAIVQRGAYHYIRSGNYEKADSFLKESGYLAKAASLHGHKFTEIVYVDDEAKDVEMADETVERVGTGKKNTDRADSYRVLGNVDRDIWKRVAFNICDTKKELPVLEKAVLGALCGHRQSMLNVAGSWEDKLWAYLKTLLDMEIEERLRACSIDFEAYVQLPDQYWSQKLSLAECLSKVQEDLTANKISAENIITMVQQHVVLDDVGGFLQLICRNIENILDDSARDPVINGHIIRFLTHLIFFFGVVELDENFKSEEETVMNLCSEAYIQVLVNAGQFCYIPFYVNKLSEHRQIPAVLSRITPNLKIDQNDITCFLQAAALNDLDVLQMAIAIVEKFRNFQQDFDVRHLRWIVAAYDHGHEKSRTMVVFLRFALLIARKFLALGNVQKVRLLLGEVNDVCLEEVLRHSERFRDSYIRELACYRAYLDADEALNAWRKAQKQKPNFEDFENSVHSSGTASLADRSRLESRKLDFENATVRWKRAVEHFLDNALAKFIELLVFPGGWLLSCASWHEDDQESDTEIPISKVRKILVPKVVLMLLKLVQERRSQEVMRSFLYVFCDDTNQIHQELTSAEKSTIYKALEELTRSFESAG